MKIKNAVNIALLIVLSFKLNAQTKLESWRDHLPFTAAFQVLEADSRIYCATPGGLFYFNKADNSINKFTRIEGLSDMGISAIAYSASLKTLIIGYTNGNIDLFENNHVTNISDIKIKTSLGNKTINHLFVNNSNVYISCGFGIVLLNLVKNEITDTYYIGDNGTHLEVFCVTTDDQFIYAATAEGLKKASLSDPNLYNFASWSKISDIPNSNKKFTKIIYSGTSIIALCSSSDQAYADKVYFNQGSGWLEANSFTNDPFYYSIESNQGQVVISGLYNCFIFNNNLNKTNTVYNGDPRYAIADKDNLIWIADPNKGMIRITLPNTTDIFIPNGPLSPKAFSLVAAKNRLLVLGGGQDASYNNRWFHAELSFFENQLWTHITTDSIRDPLNAVFDPANPDHIYIASWGYGVIEVMNHQIVKIYNDKNSSLLNIIPGSAYVRVGGVALDKYGNLWATNTQVPNAVSVRKTTGEWKNFKYNSIANLGTLGKILITKSNIKWIIIPHGGGLFAFDDRNTDTQTDDLTNKFSVSDINGSTISNFIYSMAEDLDGNMWVGTSSGPAVYYNPDAVFSGDNFYATQVIIPRKDGTIYGDLLLATETITAIAIDGANRKWFGTQNSGVYLMSADGVKQIYHFNTANSPILSNSITDIAIDPASGEVFIGTDQGVISFRSTATLGGDAFGKVYVFPNPVRPEYQGNIVVTGLIRDTNVKITDISGNLVFETTSLGGQAIWNGKNMDGKRASTGVYLVFCTNEDGSQTFITKLLFIH